RIIRPEPGSLYDIMHDHHGASLYVLPICWNDMHARLLRVRFVELQPIMYPIPGPQLCGWDACPPARIANDLARELTTLFSSEKTTRWFTKTQAIKAVMSIMFPETLSRPKSNAELDLHFGDRVFKKVVRMPVLWRREASGTSFDSAVTQPAASLENMSASCQDDGVPSTPPQPSQPLLAYINRKQLKAIRSNLYRICSGPVDGDHRNTPVQHLQQLRSRQLIPFDEDHDAHYIAIMIAMAQAHFYSTASSKSSSQSSPRFGGGRIIDNPPTSFSNITVHLITHAEAEFVVYEAVITSTFLERFAHPTKAPAEDVDPGLQITFHRVPVWPILGLKERLARALGYEIAGNLALHEFDGESNDIETWLDPEEKRNVQRIKRRIASIGMKRRRAAEEREVLSERVNSSFEDDATSCASTSEDLPVLSPDAKRRCTRTTNPLEVC
ncbi:hypothetical protein CONLIGDRAFT_564645, partial [Coniochaeta ligniaria NRRL 30616]